MATKEENDELWNLSVTNKSWVEMVEEEDVEFAALNRSESTKQTDPVKNGIVATIKKEVDEFRVKRDVMITRTIETVKISTNHAPDLMAPRNVASIITEEESCDMHISGLTTIAEESNDSKESPPLKNVTQTYANILKKSPSAEIPSSNKIEAKQELKKESNKDFLQEDISLSGHIEGFQLASPCKTANEFKTPTKTLEVPNIRSSPRNLKRKILQDGSSSKIPDEVLMPSPSKIPRPVEIKVKATDSPQPLSSSGRGHTTGSGSQRYLNNRKRSRDMQTPPSNRRYRPPQELETNEEVLARRQKQIDYGKNTIGYERYTQLVPKECRKSIHPRTPPMHLKYSRRAWEGMVRIWRQRLHFWDPPSEGGGDPSCLEGEEFSEMSDISSTDGSLPSTPVQDMKRRQVYVSPAGSHPRHYHMDAAKSLSLNVSSPLPNDDDDDQGCLPLSPD